MVNTTDNHGLRKYSQGEDDWDHGDTVDKVEIGAPLRDVESNVGNYIPHSDAWFWATDSDAIYLADGTSWSKVGYIRSEEDLRDFVAAFITGGTDIEVNHDDPGDTLTIDYVGSGGSGGAPTDAEYWVSSSDPDLSNEHVVPIDPNLSLSSGQILKYDAGLGYLTSAGDATSDGGTTSIAEELGTNGNVVWMAPNDNGVVSGGNASPVQDAINAIDAAGGQGSGAVLLPLGEITETGPITNTSRKSILGWGIGRGETGEHTTTLTIDGGGDGILVEDYHDANWTYLDNFTLKAGDRSDGRAAIRFTDFQLSRLFNVGLLRFHDWTNTTSQTNPGVISYETGNNFRSNWDMIWFQNTDGPCIRVNDEEPYNVRMGVVNAAPRNPSDILSVPVSGSSPVWHIDTLQGGSKYTRRLAELNLAEDGRVSINQAVLEPNDKAEDNSQTSEAFKLEDDGSTHIWNFVSKSIELDRVVEMGDGCANKILGRIAVDPGTDSTANHVIEITGTMAGENWYFGPSSDVTDTANAGTNNLVCFADLADGTYGTG